VVLAGVRNKQDAQSVTDMNIATLVPVLLDVTDEATSKAVMKKVKEMTEKTSLPLVALVNNAGE
jgi:NADP-dependent 3-hydroxy acid dehydrogenase YdfG